MNNMYDILNKFNSVAGKQTLTEGARPDFLDLDKDGDRKEPIKQAAKQAKHKDQVDEISMDQIGRGIGKAIGVPARIAGAVAGIPGGLKQAYQTSKAGAQKAISGQDVDCYPKTSKVAEGDVEEGSTGDYSAKKARAGKDIGKPGKAFAQIAKSAGERYGSKERGEKVAGAVLAKLRAKESIEEADMEEGNDFTGARLAAIKAGKPTFKVDGKTYRVTGDTSDEKVMEKKEKTLWPGSKEYKDKYGEEMRPGEKRRSSTGGEIERTATGVKHTAKSYDDEENRDDRDDDTPKKKGRPKGSKRALGAKVKGTSKLHSKPSIKEEGLEDDAIALVDKGEYDREGDMAREQLHTVMDAAKELHSILDSDDNLPEWVQSKITKALDYLDTARDYVKASDAEDAEQVVPERKLTKPEMKKREEIVKSMKKNKGDFEKRYGERGEEVMYATATKQAKKKAEESKDKEEVEETTVAGSVATAPADAPKGKKGMQFGKGVYEGAIAESFNKKLDTVLTEGMSINMSVGEDGQKSLNINATDDDAIKLAQILKLAGMGSSEGYHDACPACGQSPCGCEEGVAEGEYANSPDVEESDTDTMVNTLSGGLNGPKTTGQTTIPVIASQLDRQVTKVKEDAESKLWDLYKKY